MLIILSLADILFEIGLNAALPLSKICLERSLLLYEFNVVRSKTYSFDRNNKIEWVKEVLFRFSSR